MSESAIEYGELDRALRSLGFRMDAAEYHGALCGMLCVQDCPPEDLGLETDAPATAEPATGTLELLQQLRSDSLDDLCDAESGFMPLLPKDDEALDQRVDALAQWCQGFLYGLATWEKLDLDQASPELREVVDDLIQISRAGAGDDDTEAEADENAYMELVEYVRTGVQLVFLELRPVAQSPDVSGTLH